MVPLRGGIAEEGFGVGGSYVLAGVLKQEVPEEAITIFFPKNLHALNRV